MFAFPFERSRKARSVLHAHAGPCVRLPRASGLTFESPQGRNPRAFVRLRCRDCYGDLVFRAQAVRSGLFEPSYSAGVCNRDAAVLSLLSVAC